MGKDSNNKFKERETSFPNFRRDSIYLPPPIENHNYSRSNLIFSSLINYPELKDLGKDNLKDVNLNKSIDLGKSDLMKSIDLGKSDLMKSIDLGKSDLNLNSKSIDLGKDSMGKSIDLGKDIMGKSTDLSMWNEFYPSGSINELFGLISNGSINLSNMSQEQRRDSILKILNERRLSGTDDYRLSLPLKEDIFASNPIREENHSPKDVKLFKNIPTEKPIFNKLPFTNEPVTKPFLVEKLPFDDTTTSSRVDKVPFQNQQKSFFEEKSPFEGLLKVEDQKKYQKSFFNDNSNPASKYPRSAKNSIPFDPSKLPYDASLKLPFIPDNLTSRSSFDDKSGQYLENFPLNLQYQENLPSFPKYFNNHPYQMNSVPPSAIEQQVQRPPQQQMQQLNQYSQALQQQNQQALQQTLQQTLQQQHQHHQQQQQQRQQFQQQHQHQLDQQQQQQTQHIQKQQQQRQQQQHQQSQQIQQQHQQPQPQLGSPTSASNLPQFYSSTKRKRQNSFGYPTGSNVLSPEEVDKKNLVPAQQVKVTEDGRPLLGATKVDQLMLVIQARDKGVTDQIRQAPDGSILGEQKDGVAVLPKPDTLVGGVEKPKDEEDESNKKRNKSQQCQFCLKYFTQSTHLEVHIRSHIGFKPFECNFCHKKFTQGGNLRTHLRLHTGEKPFTCDVCNKSFSRKGNLAAHKLTHENLKPYECKLDGCDKSFIQLGNLKSHQNRFHLSTLNELTHKLAELSGDALQRLPPHEKDLLNYFKDLYKNSNKGIRGRGKTKQNEADAKQFNNEQGQIQQNHHLQNQQSPQSPQVNPRLQQLDYLGFDPAVSGVSNDFKRGI